MRRDALNYKNRRKQIKPTLYEYFIMIRRKMRIGKVINKVYVHGHPVYLSSLLSIPLITLVTRRYTTRR
ncbi:hypothetical protein BDZ94DRAFT_1257592 [Collybia nuda]|uniref:Uncharacterized protein n=1 Tax=Collybia nuda TaxID=64659 RepID=A0A9P6CF94_9AGAR|nr:hypothetical protein BDZ94DRAFT_1257592 [Collybia nuda]